MTLYKLFSRIGIVCIILSLYSCAEDKFFDVGGYVNGTVNFKAVNLDFAIIGDSAESSPYKDYRDLPYKSEGSEINSGVNIPIITSYYPGITDDNHESYFILRINKESEIWACGYNEIQITFCPSCPEEKNATFTMPDGSVFEASIDHPTFIWTPDSTYGEDKSFSVYDNFIKAESHYAIGKTVYNNVGYIFVDLSNNLCYDKNSNKLYYGYWYLGEPPTVESYVKFTVENLMVESPDTCTSYRYGFPGTEVSSETQISIPCIGYGGNEHIFTTTLTGNQFFACGNTDILFTFYPIEGQSEMQLRLPNNSDVTLTEENPFYIWHLSKEEAHSYYFEDIYAYSSFVKGGVAFKCVGIVKMYCKYDLWFDSETGIFHYDYWY